MPMDGRKQEDTASGTGWSAGTERSADSNSADDEDAADEGGGLALHIAMAALSAMRLRGGLATREPMLPSRFPGLLRSGVILGYPTGYSQHNIPNKWCNTSNAKGVVSA